MKKSRRCGLRAAIFWGLLLSMVMVMLAPSHKSYAMSGDISDTDFNVLSVWEYGYLNEKTGTEETHGRRIRTAEYYLLTGNSYDVALTAPEFTVKAFYYDDNKSYLFSEKLYDKQVIEVKSPAKYVRFDITKNSNEKTMSLGQYGRCFGSSIAFAFSEKNSQKNTVIDAAEANAIAQSEDCVIVGDIANEDFNRLAVWEYGYLDEASGLGRDHGRRIRTAGYYALNYDSYKVSLYAADFTVRAFYYDENRTFLSSEKIYEGQIIQKAKEAKYVKFDIRKNSYENSMSLGQYGKCFGNTIKIAFESSLQYESNGKENVVTESHELFDEVSVSSTKDFALGVFDSATGEIINSGRRLVRSEYYPIYEQTITVSFNQEGYSAEIYEYDENNNFIKMTVASNGSNVSVTEKTRFIRFCIYRLENEKGLSLGQWGRLFSAGLEVTIDASEGGNDSVATDNAYAPQPEAETVKTPHKALYDEMLQMLMTGDRSVHDISQYGLDIYELRAIESELREGEGHYYFAASSQMFLGKFGLKNNICTTMGFECMDTDFLNRYNRMMDALNEIKSMVTSQMTDLDKVILAHDYIVTHAYYEKTSTQRGCTGGILGDGHGLCVGFAKAFNDAMRYLGVETKTVSSSDMNHEWSMVKIDGQYYHVDCTWDNSHEEKYGYVGHSYLLASDTRFKKSIPSRHYNWTVSEKNVVGGVTFPATSTKFDNWFVHDVKSLMVYANGYWYYADGATIKKSDAYGYSTSTVLTETGNVSIISLSQGKLQYKVNGTVKTINVK